MKPRCKYFGVCGGCQHQDVAYQEQLQQKKEVLKTLFGQEVDILAHPQPYNYRNRMDFFVSPDKLGLKKQHEYDQVVDIDRCEIQHEALNNVLLQIRSWVDKHNIQGARPGMFEGFLRYVMLRGDEQSQQVTLTTTNDSNEELVDELAQTLDVDSLVWTIEHKSTERSVGTQTHKVYGQTHITQTLAGKTFRIDSHTFFQTSPYMASQAIEHMKQHITSSQVHDLYCGVGILGQCIADTVVGVDNNQENIQQAKRNAEINGVNATYHCADAAAWLIGQNVQTVIVDPPRTGLKTGVHTLMAAKPQTIVYLSCNPKTQAQDLAVLKSQYEVQYIQGFDFFPHTDHIENLVVLQRIS